MDTSTSTCVANLICPFVNQASQQYDHIQMYHPQTHKIQIMSLVSSLSSTLLTCPQVKRDEQMKQRWVHQQKEDKENGKEDEKKELSRKERRWHYWN